MFSSHTNTCSSGSVQRQSLGTLASERALCVHASAVCAHGGENLALVNIYRWSREVMHRHAVH